MAERVLTVNIIGNDQSLRRAFGRSAKGAAVFNRDLSRITRGALAGSGVFRGLGRSIAFASGGFLAFASAGQFLRTSIDAAKEAQVTQKQLAAQFRASGKDLSAYQGQIDKTANSLSLLSGFQNDEIKAGFTTIFRTTNDVTKALRDTATAADLARAKHLSFAQASLIIAKTEAGNTTLLRRQGFQIAKNAKSEEALAKLRGIVAGQAKAGTTAQERFGAVLHNTEEIIGAGLLPTLNKYLARASTWLTQMNESGKLQKDVANAAKRFGEALSLIVGTIRTVDKVTGSFANTLKDLAGVWLLLKVRTRVIKWLAIAEGMKAAATAAKTASAATKGLAVAEGGVAASGVVARVAAYTGGVAAVGSASEGAAAKVGLLEVALSRLALPGLLGLLAGGLLALQKGFADAAKTTLGFKVSGGVVTENKADGSFQFKPDNATRGSQRPRRITPAQAAALGVATFTSAGPVGAGGSPRDDVIAAANARRLRTQTGAGGLSLQGRFNIAELRLANAQLTKTSADDIRILNTEAKITREQINHVKTLKQKTELTQRLVGIMGSLASLTQQADQFVLPIGIRTDVARAGATITTADDLAIAKQVKAAIISRLPGLHGEALISAYDQLGQVNQQLAAAVAEAGKFVESPKLLLAQAKADAQAAGIGATDLTKAQRSVLVRMRAAARKALKSGKLAVQGQIDAWNEIASANQELINGNQHTKFQVANTKKLLAGLGLTPAQEKAARARLTQLGPGGTVPRQTSLNGGFGGQTIVTHTTVTLDGQKVGSSVTRTQQKSRKRNPPQKRGPHAGAASA